MPFPVSSTDKQDYVLVPALLAIFFNQILGKKEEVTEGLYIRFYIRIFTLSRLLAQTMLTEELILELLFADDSVLLPYNEMAL